MAACYVCKEFADNDDFCHGCGEFIHEACEGDPVNPPMGHGHDPSDHLLTEDDKL
jgi:hypothetical protein